MADGERDQARLEQNLAELTRRISELENRIAEIEGRPSSAATTPAATTPAASAAPPEPEAAPTERPAPDLPAPALHEPDLPPVPQDPWRGVWPQGSWPQQSWGQPPAGQPQAGPPDQSWPKLPFPPLQNWGPPPQQRSLPQDPRSQPPRPASPVQPDYRHREPGYAGSAHPGDRPAPPAALPAAALPAARPPARPPQRPPKAPSISTGPAISLASLRDLESRLTGRLLAWVGAAAVVLGAVFFLSLAFSRGWIGPEGRVFLGVAGGEAFAWTGAWLLGRRQASLGQVLVAVGLGVVSLSLFAGTRFYGLFQPEWALAGSFLSAVMAAAVAVRVKSEAVAIFGLLAVAAAPPLMGAGANAVTIAFLAMTVVGTTGISLAKSWRWLPPTAFLLTAPQLVYWLVSKPDAATAVVAIGAYWLLHAVAAAADEIRGEKDETATARAESLFMANSIVAIVGGLWVLSGDQAAWQGTFMAAAALAHFAFGAYFVWRRGDMNPFGLFVNAIGAAAVAIAIERQFDGALVVVGWAIEGAVLAAVFGFRRNTYAGGAAALLGALEVAHLFAYEYSCLNWTLAGGHGSGPFAFADSAGVALGGVLIAGFVSGLMSKSNAVRLSLLIAGSVVSAYSLPFELSGPALVAGWALEGAALAGVWRIHRIDYLGWTAAVIGALAVVHLGVYEYPLLNWWLEGTAGPGPFAFVDSAGLALGCLLLAGFVAGWLSRSREVRFGLLVSGSAVVAYALPFELTGAALVAAWAAEGAALVAVWGFRRNDYVGIAGLMATLAIAHLGAYEYPLAQSNFKGVVGPGQFAFADEAGLALGCLLLAGLVAGWLSRSREVRFGLLIAGSLVVAYALPFELSGAALVAGWAAEAVALTVVWGLRRNEYLGWTVASIAALAVLHLGLYQYPVDRWALPGVTGPGPFAFADESGLALGCLLVAGFLVGLLSRSHSVRCGLASGGLLLVAYALPFELSGVALAGALAALIPASIAAEGLLDLLPGVPASRARLRTTAVILMKEAHWPDSPLVPAGMASCLAVAHLLLYEMPVRSAGAVVVPSVPFADLATAAAGAGVVAFLLAALITARPDVRVGAIVVAAAIAAYTSNFELALPYAVVAWCALAAALGAWSFRAPWGRWAYVTAGAVLVGSSVVAILGQIDPVERLGVQSNVPSTGVWFAVNSILAVGAASVTVVAAARFLPLSRPVRQSMTLASGIALVYLASAIVVDFFQRQLGGATALEELQKQAQVGVSILWAAIGMVVFLAGIVAWRQGVRESGLALLALATAKVFLFDLSYLDVAYRVLSLIGLGLLLLAGAFAYQSLRPSRPASADGGDPDEPIDEATDEAVDETPAQ